MNLYITISNIKVSRWGEVDDLESYKKGYLELGIEVSCFGFYIDLLFDELSSGYD